MRLIDWIVLGVTVALVVVYGLWRSRGARSVEHHVLAGRTMSWHVMALSIMATQASAVTFISTTGQSYADGMRFVQFYFGLPLAMGVLCFTAVPLFHRAKVHTAYQYLEHRFDAKTRTLVSIVFLIQRGLALGISLYAPAVILTVLLGWRDWITTLVMGVLAVTFTMTGGVKATSWSQSLQMIVMTVGLIAALICALTLLPSHVSFRDALTLAGAAGRLNIITTKFDWNDRYNLWSGLFGGMFLALAYFGTDQSQVQCYLTGKSVRQSRLGLLFNAVAKIPMQFFILFIGVMIFVFYIYQRPPASFDPTTPHTANAEISRQYQAAFEARKEAADRLIIAHHSNDLLKVRSAEQEFSVAQKDFDKTRQGGTGKAPNDINYIFLSFVTRYLPPGLIGLVLAVILGATMSSIASEMNALANVSIIDIYKRHVRKGVSEVHHLFASRFATLLWGAYAVFSAQYVKHVGSLIEAVNLLGSFFYGGMLGVFVLAFFFKSVRGRGAFCGVLAGEGVIFGLWYFTNIAYLWYNVIGCVVVVLTGVVVTIFERPKVSSDLRSASGLFPVQASSEDR